VDALRARGLEVATGVLRADMAVELVNDGRDHPAGGVMRIEAVLGDITCEHTDAIVNAANSACSVAAVSTARIHGAAGPATAGRVP